MPEEKRQLLQTGGVVSGQFAVVLVVFAVNGVSGATFLSHKG
jgi:hypothetical protein